MDDKYGEVSSPFHSGDDGIENLYKDNNSFVSSSNLHSFGVEPSERKSVAGRMMSIADNVPAPTTNSRNMTIFLMLNTMIGSGILNQPQVFEKAGIIGALLVFAVAAIFTWFGNVILVVCGLEAKVMGYPEVVKHVLGDNGTILLNALIVIGNIGAVMSYVALVGDTTADLLQGWGASHDVVNVYSCTIFMISVFVLPLCMYRHYGHLGNIAYVSIGCISLILVMVCIGGPIEGEGGNIRQFNMAGMLQKLGSVVFALSCTPAAFLAYNSTNNCNVDLWRDIMGQSTIWGSLMCVVMGIDTDGEILSNFTAHWADPFKMMLIMHIVLYIPGDFVVLRLSTLKLIQHGQREVPLDTPYHALLSFALLAVCTVLVMLLQATGMSNGDVFGTILDFSGGIAFSCISYVLPAWLYIVMHYNRYLNDIQPDSSMDDVPAHSSSISSLTVSDFGSLWADESYKQHAAKDPYHWYCCCMLAFGVFTLVAVPCASIAALAS